MKRKIFLKWRKMIVAFLAVCGCGMFVSCYGAPAPDDEPDSANEMSETAH